MVEQTARPNSSIVETDLEERLVPSGCKKEHDLSGVLQPTRLSRISMRRNARGSGSVALGLFISGPVLAFLSGYYAMNIPLNSDNVVPYGVLIGLGVLGGAMLVAISPEDDYEQTGSSGQSGITKAVDFGAAGETTLDQELEKLRVKRQLDYIASIGRVIDKIWERGYIVTNAQGARLTSEDSATLAPVQLHTHATGETIELIIAKGIVAHHVAVMHINDSNTTYGRKWGLAAYYTKEMPLLRRLAKDISEIGNAKVTVVKIEKPVPPPLTLAPQQIIVQGGGPHCHACSIAPVSGGSSDPNSAENYAGPGSGD